MPYADLHVHTTRSDGSLELADVPAAARRADVAVVAVTDHDRLQPFDETAVERDGVTLVQGIELRVETESGQRVDLLGYGVERTDALVAETERIQRDRRERGRKIVERVEERLGIDLGLEVDTGFGRPHVARAIASHPDSGHDYRGAFDHLIGNDGPCYVPRDVTSFSEGREILVEACSIVSLAHPLRYPDPESALALAADLDAVELAYPYGREVDLEPVERTIERYDLLATGGTDAHETELGVAGLSQAEYEALELPVPVEGV
ncbi:PHP domain-containing protein [Natronosalvus caseinilyticus]|uniref:PHP domain-containing protein n=1 Tax=Natronosalvus caseinilyticus TaxID=2953747 RepID=UPI0028A80449|nr:PHP domain-containing protein [Natronosalvus caseinilyticus]